MKKTDISKLQDTFKVEELLSKLNTIHKYNNSKDVYMIQGRTIFLNNSKLAAFTKDNVIEIINCLIEEAKVKFVEKKVIEKIEKVKVSDLYSGVVYIIKKEDVEPIIEKVETPKIRITFTDTESDSSSTKY